MKEEINNSHLIDDARTIIETARGQQDHPCQRIQTLFANNRATCQGN